MIDVDNASNEIVEDVDSSFVMYFLCGLPSGRYLFVSISYDPEVQISQFCVVACILLFHRVFMPLFVLICVKHVSAMIGKCSITTSIAFLSCECVLPCMDGSNILRPCPA